MKKVISIILVLMMVLGLCACGQSGSGNEAGGLQVGYAKGNITPSMLGIPMGGYGNAQHRLSTGYLDYTYATVIAITDELGETVLLITNDLIRMPGNWTKATRQAITQATGIPEDRIMLCATHSHASVDVGSAVLPTDPYFTTDYSKAVVQACQDALADRSPATIQTGSGTVENMNFVRHYLMSDGSYAGDNHGSFDGATIVKHATEADNEFQLIRFVRAAEDKKDVLMMNWQAHPGFTGGSDQTVISADFIGTIRDHVEKNTGLEFFYVTGPAGNLNATSRIDSETRTKDHKEYGQIMGDEVIKVLGEGMKDVNSGNIETTQVMFTGKIDRSEDHLLDIAKQVTTQFKTTGDRTAANNLAKANGLQSVYHATSIVSRSTYSDDVQMELNMIGIGDISVITAPYEMFDTQGMFIKENTPYDTTIIMTLANGMNNYIASEFAFEYGCYEVDNHLMEKGTAEALADKYVEVLKTMHADDTPAE